MRQLIYYVACTVDRFIAREDGSFDFFLPEGEHFRDLLESFPETIPTHMREPLGVSSEKRWFDAVLMGRRTYEVGLNIGVTSPYSHLEQYVFSRSMSESPDPEVKLVSENQLAVVRELKSRPGKAIWLCGGGELSAELFAEIDEMILKVSPVLLGSGIPLFARPVEQTPLALVSSKIYDNGFTLLHYRLAR